MLLAVDILDTLIMPSNLLPASVLTAFIITISVLCMRRLRSSLTPHAPMRPDHVDSINRLPEPSEACKALKSALGDATIIASDGTAFVESMKAYWAQQECEVVPECVCRPHDTLQLSTAVKILKRHYDQSRKEGDPKAGGWFAIRSGGHSPIPGAASIKGGVLIDLSLFCEVTPSADSKSIVVGTGARWADVSNVLDEKGLAMVGGRNSAVGVGGLTLGGGLSFFSPRYGLVCSNIIWYEVVLASGSIVTASASINPDLWKALKGGSNNFGIITRFRARAFPSSSIWSGFLYMPGFQAGKVLRAFHEYVNRADSSKPTTTYDENSAGPLACFSYIQALRSQLISVNLVYTKLPETKNNWPNCWQTSSFASLWRFWSTCQVRTLTSATGELNTLNPPGRRQMFGNVTIKNDSATLAAAHASYCDAFASLRPNKVKGLVFTLVLQPLLPDWVRKGDPNPLGLHAEVNEPLVIVSFTVNWDEIDDDNLVKTTIRRAVEQIETIAAANKTGHPYRYLNYCQEWQKPFEGYGKENLQFLHEVSRRYDPDGLFQKGCMGGFKLGMNDQ